MIEVLLPIVIITVLILLNGLFVAAEFAIVGARQSRIASLTEEGVPAAKAVGRVLESAVNQDRYIAIAQVGITLMTIGLGMYGEPAIASWIYGPTERLLGVSNAVAHTIGTILAVSVMTYFHVVVGEMIPKALALQTPERTAISVSYPMRVMGFLFFPLVAVLNAVAVGLMRLFRIPVAVGHARLHTPEELELLVVESAESGALGGGQQTLIGNIFEFGDQVVHQLMTPRPRIQGVPLSSTEADLEQLIDEARYSRYPAYEGSLDRIVGVIHIKDLIVQKVQGKKLDLKSILRHAPRVPEHLPAESLLAAFKRLRVHMAVVMDEFGGTAGIATLDDVVEEVIGETRSELDSNVLAVEVVDNKTLLARGDVLLDDLNNRYSLGLVSKEAVTLGGFVLERLGRAAVADDTIELEQVKLLVEEVERLAIRQVRVVLLGDHSFKEQDARAVDAPDNMDAP